MNSLRLRNFSRQEKPKPVWNELSLDMLELVLSKLPEASVIRAGNVCKQWYSVTQEPTFVNSYKRNNLSHQGSTFSVGSGKFSFMMQGDGRLSVQRVSKCHTTPGSSLLDAAVDVIVPIYGTGGLHHYFSGDIQIELHYKLSLLEKTWRRTSPLPLSVEDPIVGAIPRINEQNETSHLIVVAGGLPMEFLREQYDDLTVSAYDEQSNSWTKCDALPMEFRGCSCSVFMGSVVHDGKFYAYDMYSGHVSRLDLDSNKWSKVTTLRIATDVKKLFLVSRSENLFVVGVQDSGQRDLRFNVWELIVDSETVRVGDLVDCRVLPNIRPPLPSVLDRWMTTLLTPFIRVLAIGMVLLIHLIMFVETIAKRVGTIGFNRFSSPRYDNGEERPQPTRTHLFFWISLFATNRHDRRNPHSRISSYH